MEKASRGRKERSDKGKSRGKKNVKKLASKRSAYKKSVKSQMVMRRAPMVETKQRVHSDIAYINGHLPEAAGALLNPLNWRTLLVDDAFTSIPLKSWHRQSNGFKDYQCIGNSIFSKFLNFKLQFRFPRNESLTLPDAAGTGTYQATNAMIQQPTKVFLICGWITESMNYPLVNDVSPSLPAQSDADIQAINNYITQQLKPYFDDDEDKLQFRPKQTTNIKIDKYVRLKPNLTTAIGSQATPAVTLTLDGTSQANSSQTGTFGQNYGPTPSGLGNEGNVTTFRPATGSIPDIHKSWSVKTNRKIPLTQGEQGDVKDYPVDNQNLYPNNSWVPFCVIYNPDYQAQTANFIPDAANPGQFTQVQFMEYRWNDAHYFTDS